MEKLHRQVAKARRRLLWQQFASVFSWFLFGTLLVAAVAIVVSRFVAVGVEPLTWLAAWMIGAVVVAIAGAGAMTFLRRKSTLEAAIEIDRRYGLKERVSSSLALDEEVLNTPIGQALVADAMSRIERIDVNERFGLKLDRRVLLPLLPAAVAFVAATFFDVPGVDNPAAAGTSQAAQEQVKASTQALQKKLAERREEAKEKGLGDAEGLFKKLEEGTKELAGKNEVDKKQALVKLNDLAEDLKKRRSSLGAEEKFKQQLSQMKDLKSGPADTLGKALKNGDLGAAVKELDKLQKQLANENLDPQQREQLAQQLNQMKESLQKAAAAHEEAKQQAQQQLDQARKAGDTAAAEKAQQQLDKLSQQNKQMQKAQQMAKNLQKAAEGCKNGQCKDAAAALDQVRKELDEMKQQGDELSMVDDALEQIDDAKESMGCKECNGKGCAACQGKGQQGGKGGKGKGGNGLGEAIGGFGDRPENKDGKTGFYDSNVKQNVGKGRAVVTGLADGANRKGEVQEGIKAEFENARSEQADPLSGQRLPHEYRDHAKKYFDALRQGQK